MNRTLGEKSYNPVRFEIDFWGTKAGDDNEYRSFRERKIRGNILLAAYYTPISAQELSIELGVAMPYLCLLYTSIAKDCASLTVKVNGESTINNCPSIIIHRKDT